MHTTVGTWSVRLTTAFVGLFTAWFLYVRAAPFPRPTFFSDPIHAVLILGAAAAAIAGGAAGVAALIKRDRTAGVYLAVLLGALALYWTVLELHHS